MDLTPLQLVTIVAETVLEEGITRELLELGATGYTVSDVRGRGSRGIRSGDVPGTGIRIEVVVRHDAADRIMEKVRDRWFASYAVIAWRTDIHVVRGEKHVRGDP